jgi:hypothetical protein
MAGLHDVSGEESFAATSGRPLAGDPAELTSDFADHLNRIAVPLDARPDAHVEEEALSHTSVLIREQSLFEYAERKGEGAVDLLAEAAATDADRQVRWNSLWALQKIGTERAARAVRSRLADDDPDVAEWAKLFSSELESGRPAFDSRPAKFYKENTFDEVLYLNISVNVFVKLDPDGRNWGKLTLSPQGLARSYGQAHACPNIDTRDHTLIISKINNLIHDDGSPHVETFPFRGLTSKADKGFGSFRFEANVERPVFLSGKADDVSAGVASAPISVPRYGQWSLDPRIKIKGEPAIRYVRGRVNTWAYVNLERMQLSSMEEILFPGNSILGTPDFTDVPLANAYVSGTFKGKLTDWDGDGQVDINSIPVYATRDGLVDTNMDGVADDPNVHYCNATGWKK